MKRLLFLLFLIFIPAIVSAEVLTSERVEIQNQVNLIINYANNGDFDSIANILSKNSREGLRNEIEINLAEKNIRYGKVLIGSYKQISGNQVKVGGSYEVRSPNWKSSGSLMYFTFEKSGNKWLLIDTNFHQIIFPGYILKKIGSIFALVIPILLIFTIFWFWMLIDCINRTFSASNEKLLWILLMILTGIIGAVLYYFIVKRKGTSQEKSQK